MILLHDYFTGLFSRIIFFLVELSVSQCFVSRSPYPKMRFSPCRNRQINQKHGNLFDRNEEIQEFRILTFRIFQMGTCWTIEFPSRRTPAFWDPAFRIPHFWNSET